MKAVFLCALASVWVFTPGCKPKADSDVPASPPVVASPKTSASKMPSDIPPPPPPPPSSSARKIPEYHVPRLFFVLAGADAFNKNEKQGLNEVRLAINEFTRRQMDYYDLGLVQTGFEGNKACTDSVQTTTAAGHKVQSPIKDALATMNPAGAKTNLAAALDEIRKKSFTKKAKTMVILFTTGAEACGADLCAAASALAKASHDIYFDVIAYRASPLSKKAFECVTNVGRGQYLAVKDSESTYDAIETVLGKNICPPMAMPCWEKGLSSRVEANRARVVEHCCSLSSPVAFRCPYKALLDPSDAIKDTALKCLLSKKWSRKPEAMRLALKDKSKAMRSQVITALEASPPTARMKALMATACKDVDLDLASRSLRLVAISGHPWREEVLAESLSDSRAGIRRAVIKSLEGRYESWVFEFLKQAASDGEQTVRLQVAKTAGSLKDARVREVLSTLASDKNKAVQAEAITQQKNLKGKSTQ
jgi:hypothetical protein